MGKLSKTDQPDNQEETREALARLHDTSRYTHFTVGSEVVMNRRRGSVLYVAAPRSPLFETRLRIQWEDGSVSSVTPFALNRRPPHH